jgi:hypothetical protein
MIESPVDVILRTVPQFVVIYEHDGEEMKSNCGAKPFSPNPNRCDSSQDHGKKRLFKLRNGDKPGFERGQKKCPNPCV